MEETEADMGAKLLEDAVDPIKDTRGVRTLSGLTVKPEPPVVKWLEDMELCASCASSNSSSVTELVLPWCGRSKE